MTYGYALRDIVYDIPPQDKQDISEEIKRIYLEMQETEAIENAADVAAGIPEDELEWECKAPYSLDNPVVKSLTEELEQELYRNSKGLLSTMVVDITNNKSTIGKDAVILAVEETFGCKVKSAKDFGSATYKEFMNSLNIKAMHHIIESKQFQEVISLKSQLRNYSASNLANILYQKPNAEFVRTFKGWGAFNRCPALGSKSIRIYGLSNETISTKEKLNQVFNRPKSKKSKGWYERSLEKIEKGESITLREPITIYLFDVSDTVLLKGKDGNLLPDLYKDKRDACEKLIYTKNMAQEQKIYEYVCDITKNDITPAPYDGTAKCIFDTLYDYTEYILRTDPIRITGIRDYDPVTGDTHSLEVLFAVGIIAENLGLWQMSDTVSSRVGEIFEKNRYSNGSDMLTVGLYRGGCMSNHFLDIYEQEHETLRSLGDAYTRKVSSQKKRIEKDDLE
jgi:hypothetical protein